jgi:hypothetical protein
MVVDGDEPHTLSRPITIDEKLYFTRQQGRPARVTRRGSPPRHVSGNAASRARRAKVAQAGARGQAEGGAHGGAQGDVVGNKKAA